MTPRFARVVEKATIRQARDGMGPVVLRVTAAKLLQREHAAVVRKVRAMYEATRLNGLKLKHMKKPDHITAPKWHDLQMISSGIHVGKMAALDDLLTWLHERGR